VRIGSHEQWTGEQEQQRMPSSPSRYLHAVEGRDREVEQALSRLAEAGDVAKLPRKIGT
jgi:hypothetical protein